MQSNRPLNIQVNFIIRIWNKIISEWKTILEIMHRTKPLKIVEINKLSHVPGETKLLIQVSNKNCVVKLSAKEVYESYTLNKFNKFHADLIEAAIQGKLINFLKTIYCEAPLYKITSKKFDRILQKYIFTIQSKTFAQHFTVDELSKNKYLLQNMSVQDIYDVGHTQATESILREKLAIILANNN